MRRQAKITAVWLVLAMAVYLLTGCVQSTHEINIIYDTQALRIERQGTETRVYDLEGNATYTFTTHKKKIKAEDAAQIREAKTTTDTDTVTIQTVYDLIVITVKGTGETLYIR